MLDMNDLLSSIISLVVAATVFSSVIAAWRYTQKEHLKLVAGALVAVAVAANLYSIYLMRSGQDAVRQREVELRLSEVAQKIDTVVSNRQIEARALVTFLADNPTLTQQDYERFLRRLLLNPELYTNVAAAPDLTIEYIFPVAGNEPARGLYYPNVPSQWPYIETMLQTGEPVLIGPINLAQGGRGFIIHDLVNNPDGSIWGVIAAVIPLERLLGFAGVSALENDFHVSITAEFNNAPGMQQLIWGDPLSNRAWVALRTTIPNGTWLIELVPREATTLPFSVLLTIHLTTVLLTTLAIWVTVVMARNRDATQQAMQSLETTAYMLDEAQRIGGIGSWIRRSDENMFTLSPQLAKLMGTEQHITLTEWMQCVPRDQVRMVSELMHNILAGQQTEFSIEHNILTKDGKQLIVHHSAEHKRYGSGDSAQAVGTLFDITAKKEAEQRLERLAYYDTLTHTPNRYFFKTQMERLLDKHQRSGQRLALLHIDLDHFKVINDSLGHQIGDEVLRITSDRIRAALHDHDLLSRTGGDEFMVAVPDVADSDEACQVAKRILHKFTTPMSVHDHEIFSAVSIGIVIYPDQAETYEDMYQRSDLALYRSKSSGRNRYHLYSDFLSTDFQRRTSLERAMRTALQRGEFFLVYQPKISVQTNDIVGIETLLRWQSPLFGNVGPDEFIPIAEETGFIVQLGNWVMNEALREFSEAREALSDDLTLSINLSPRQIQYAELEHDIRQAMDQHGISGRELELEITETFIIRDRLQCEAFMRSLSRIGVGFALDDFGTGYSNLASLRNLPLSALKIDKSFIQDTEFDQDDRIIVETMIQLGHNLSLAVVAEGVETEGQREILRQAGCDELQGYLFSAPVAMSEIVRSFSVVKQRP